VAGLSLASLIRRAPRGRAIAWLMVTLLVVFGLATFTASIIESPGRTAPWAPAFGVLAAAALIASPRFRLIVIVLGSFAILMASLIAGQPLALALVLAGVRVVELVVFCLLVGRAGRLPRLDSVGRALRFIGAAAVAAAVFALGVFIARLLAGVALDGVLPVESFIAHLVTLLVVTPLALARRSHGNRAGGVETLVQWAILLGTIVIVFSPANSLPLAFLPLPVFAWAALRLSALSVAVQLAVVASLSSASTLLGWGSFGSDALDGTDQRGSIVLLQVFLVIFAGSTMALWAKRVESETQAGLTAVKDSILRRAVEQAQTGLLLAERLADGVYIVVQANAYGLRTLGMDPDDRFFSASSDINVALPPGHPLIVGLDAVSSGTPTWRGQIELDGQATVVDAVIERGSGEAADVFAVELTDITAAREEDRRLRAIVERERALSTQYQDLARQKDDFLASVSHELRTPLSSIVGYAETLDETDLDARQQRFVATIRRNADRLQQRVEELLTAAKNAADAAGEIHPVDVDRIVVEVADDLRSIAAVRSIAIRLDGAGDLPAVLGIEDAVSRAVTNVMANAVKFSPSGSAVDVVTRVTADRVLIEIVDEGPGIPIADQERVFERFFRTESARNNAVPGTGLGLGIVRTLLEAIGGEVTIYSDGMRGTRVVMALRRVPSAHVASGSEEAYDGGTGELPQSSV